MEEFKQLTIFDFLSSDEKYKITKPIRLIELFAGIGAQAKALENLHANFEHYKVCEFDKYALASYNAIHNTDFKVSDITQLHASDLEIVDTNKYEYILTYSFPCQSLSLAGKQEGMDENSNTASSLLWEVKRILSECKELPQILLMENVPQVHSKKNIDNFEKWQNFLTSLGYKNYWQDLNAKDYGIPQNRNRCFMISILNSEGIYSFPKKEELKLRLKDMLEEEVEEKYYLSDRMIDYIVANNEKWTGNNNKSGERSLILDEEGICNCLSATDYKQPKQILIKEATKKGYAAAEEGDGVYINRPHQKRGVVQKDMIQTLKCNGDDLGVVVLGNYSPSNHNASRVVDSDGIAPTVMENHGTVTATVVAAAQRGRDESWKQEIEVSDREVANAITTVTKDSMVAIKPKGSSYTRSFGSKGKLQDGEGVCSTLASAMGTGGGNVPIIPIQLRIRKLTPKECFRLMGFSDEDFDKASKFNSKTQLYKQAGNSIVVNVLMKIFKELL